MFLKSWRSFRNATDVSGVDFSWHATFAFSKTDSPREKQPGEGRGLAGIRDLETLVLSDRQARSFTLRFRPARLRTRRKRYRHLRRIPHWLACSVSQDKFKTNWLFMLLRRLRFLWRKIVKCLGVAEQPSRYSWNFENRLLFSALFSRSYCAQTLLYREKRLHSVWRCWQNI